jgi:hypothetical protein
MIIFIFDDETRIIDIFNGIKNNIDNYGVENGNYLSYYCPVLKNLNPFSIQKPEAYLKFDYNKISSLNILDIDFELRTFQSSGLVFFHKFTLSKDKLKFIKNDYVTLYLDESQLTFELYFKNRKVSFQHRRSNLSDGNWHYVNLYLNDNYLNFTIDYESEIARFRFTMLNMDTRFYFGGVDLVELNYMNGYVGCLKNIRLNSIELSADNVEYTSDVAVGSCQIFDYCTPNPCENGGVCKQNYKTFSCDCSSTGYAGSVCHTSSLPLSCLDHKYARIKYHSFETKIDSLEKEFTSSNLEWREQEDVRIDIDGSGPLPPFDVTCRFGQSSVDPMNVTIVRHLLEADTIVPAGYQDPGSYAQKIVYKASLKNINELVRRSYQCSQFVEYKWWVLKFF